MATQPNENFVYNPEDSYGYELVLDLHDCDISKFNRESLDLFFTKLCDLTDMERRVVYFWDDVGLPPEQCQTEPHLVGTSAVCFIKTSSIVIHTLDILKRAYINFFTCKPFNEKEAEQFIIEWFDSKSVKNTHFSDRI